MVGMASGSHCVPWSPRQTSVDIAPFHRPSSLPAWPRPLTCPLPPTDVPVEKLAAMPALRSINLRFNPLNAEVRVIAPPLIKFDMLMSPEGARAPPP